MASTMPKQTYRQTTIYLLCLACLASSASMFAQSSLPDHTQDKSNNISVRVNSFKINLLQYPKNLNASTSTNSTPNLIHILDHCCLCQIKFGEIFCLAFQHYIIPSNQSECSKIIKFLHQWQ